MAKYVKRGAVLDALKIHYKTLYKMEADGLIDAKRTAGGHRLYNLEKYLLENNIVSSKKQIGICYCRVSDKSQSSNLDSQINELSELYPNYIIISDVGSSIDFEREGLKKLISLAISGDISEVVVLSKDRLVRIGFNHIEWIVQKYSNGKITVINTSDNNQLDKEISDDIRQILVNYTHI